MTDRNLISFSGDGSGVIYLKRGDAPAELLFAADVPGIREYRLGDLMAHAGQDIADVLKLSGVTRLRLTVNSIDARFVREDAIDINHCKDCEVRVRDLWAAKKYCGTIKGESSGIVIKVERQHTHGGEVDWDYGGFADQGNGRTTGCELETNVVDRTPATVRLLSAAPVRYLNAGVQSYATTRLNQGWFYPLFNFLKDLFRTFGLKI